MDNKTPPSLEDLLRLKKAEQPNDLFWEKFDSELQERTLQTFIQQEPWYRNLANRVINHSLSASMACGLLFILGMALYLNLGLESNYLVSGEAQQTLSDGVVKETMSAVELIDYAVVVNDALEKDYAVEIISIKGESEAYDFASDAISVAIGDTVDYSDTPVYASSGSKSSLNQYTQLANFAF